MATITKRGTRYKVDIRKLGVRKSATFSTKAEANAWAVDEERKIINRKNGVAENILFSAVIERYQNEVSATKKGARHEILRLNRFLRHDIANRYIQDLTRDDFERWQAERLGEVAEASVRRELNTISNIIKTAIEKWRYLDTSPLVGMDKPKDSTPRIQRYSQADIDRILFVAGYREDEAVDTQRKRVAVAMLFAIETAMRAGEIAGMTWELVDFEKRIVHLPTTKNGYSRDVPLSKEAVRLLQKLEAVKSSDKVFQMSSDILSATFRTLKQKANLDYLHFHDTRREALTRLAKKVDVMTLAKISGHRDLKILQNTYYAPNMSDIAQLLD